MENKNIFLIGFMGCGKSTVARMVAEKVGKELIEMDETIEAETEMTINEIFEKYGEEYFRDLETKLIERIAEKGNAIISCGGGAVLRQENLEAMRRNGQIVYLSATPETIYERVKYSTNRPLLNGNMNVEHIQNLMEKRLPLYEAAADAIISVDKKDKHQVLEEVISLLSIK